MSVKKDCRSDTEKNIDEAIHILEEIRVITGKIQDDLSKGKMPCEDRIRSYLSSTNRIESILSDLKGFSESKETEKASKDKSNLIQEYVDLYLENVVEEYDLDSDLIYHPHKEDFYIEAKMNISSERVGNFHISTKMADVLRSNISDDNTCHTLLDTLKKKLHCLIKEEQLDLKETYSYANIEDLYIM